MVFLLLFQTYRFPKIQQGTGNQGVLCITMHLFSPQRTFFFFFPRTCFLLIIIIFCYITLQKITVFPDVFLYSAHRRKPFYVMAWNVF